MLIRQAFHATINVQPFAFTLVLRSLLEHHQLTVNGVSLHVVQAGPQDGPVAILLHGFPEFWYGWAKQVDSLVDAGFRVWIPDQRGYGLSDKPRGLDAYRLDVVVDDIRALIQSTGKERVVLCGHDWGGAVAWRLASQFPQLLSRLIIVNVPHHAVMARRLMSSVTQLLRSSYMLFFQLPGLPEYALRRNDFALLVGTLRGYSRRGTFTDEEVERYRDAWRQPGALSGMLNWYRALLRRQPAVSAKPKIRVPTLIIWGKNDPAFDQALPFMSLELCERGELKLIENAGHWVLHEEAEKVNALMRDFLAAA